MLLASMSGMLSLWRMIKSGKRISAGRYVVVITNESNIAPFSWMRYIVLASKDYALNGEVIMKHECSHLRRRHWVDLLIAQVVICLHSFAIYDLVFYHMSVRSVTPKGIGASMLIQMIPPLIEIFQFCAVINRFFPFAHNDITGDCVSSCSCS